MLLITQKLVGEKITRTVRTKVAIWPFSWPDSSNLAVSNPPWSSKKSLAVERKLGEFWPYCKIMPKSEIWKNETDFTWLEFWSIKQISKAPRPLESTKSHSFKGLRPWTPPGALRRATGPQAEEQSIPEMRSLDRSFTIALRWVFQ